MQNIRKIKYKSVCQWKHFSGGLEKKYIYRKNMKLNKNIELNKIYKKCPVHMKSVSDKYDALLQDCQECEENDYCEKNRFCQEQCNDGETLFF